MTMTIKTTVRASTRKLMVFIRLVRLHSNEKPEAKPISNIYLVGLALLRTGEHKDFGYDDEKPIA